MVILIIIQITNKFSKLSKLPICCGFGHLITNSYTTISGFLLFLVNKNKSLTFSPNYLMGRNANAPSPKSPIGVFGVIELKEEN
jgi:hypothetical protein